VLRQIIFSGMVALSILCFGCQCPISNFVDRIQVVDAVTHTPLSGVEIEVSWSSSISPPPLNMFDSGGTALVSTKSDGTIPLEQIGKGVLFFFSCHRQGYLESMVSYSRHSPHWSVNEPRLESHESVDGEIEGAVEGEAEGRNLVILLFPVSMLKSRSDARTGTKKLCSTQYSIHRDVGKIE